MYVKELIPGVVRKLRNRDDLIPKIPGYLQKAIIELSQNFEFDELRYKGPITNFVPNQAEYPRDFFAQEGHDYITFIVSWFCFFSSTVTTSPQVNSNTGVVMKYRQPRVLENMAVIQGQPVAYSQVGEQVNAGNLIVGYMPNTNYATFMRYQIQHPFPDVDVDTERGAQVLAQQKIFMPKDWQDIIEYAAAERALDDVGMLDVANNFHMKLYGNPQKRTMGIINERLSQQQRQSEYNERQLRPTVRKY